MLTEQEARKKWCPYVRHEGAVGPFNRGTFFGPLNEHQHNNGTLCNCIASDCMSWRWIEPAERLGPTRVHPDVLRDYWKGWVVTDSVPDGRGFVEISPPTPPAQRGFCGLAGKP